jgi:hypothetical protein
MFSEKRTPIASRISLGWLRTASMAGIFTCPWLSSRRENAGVSAIFTRM